MLITSFTQTYGDKRILELELLRYDQVGSYFRNKCDYIIFSFHNCPKEFINRGKLILHSLYSKEKLIILEYSDCSYLESMRATLTKIKEKNIDYVLQIQDDQHGLNNFENINNFSSIDSIFSFLNKNSPDYLHIFESEGDKKHNKLTPVEETLLGEVVFYKYKSTDFKNANIFSWNTYFAKTDFLTMFFFMKQMPPDVWRIEVFLKFIFDNNLIYRWGIDKLYFSASQLHGRNVNSQMFPSENLKRFFGELDNWSEVENLIKNNI